MQNKYGYTHIGGQLPHTQRLTAEQVTGRSVAGKIMDIAADMVNDPRNQGVKAFEGFDHTRNWNDEALARLVADVRRDEKRCVSDFVVLDYAALKGRALMDEVEIATINAATRSAVERMPVPVEEIRQGDRIFMSADMTPRTVLCVHTSRYFITFMVVSKDDAIPFLINRHPGAIIYKEAN